MDFKTELAKDQEIVNSELKKYLRKQDCKERILNEAMEYSLMAGGKRLRPILVLETFKLFNENLEKIMPYAISIEMVHNAFATQKRYSKNLKKVIPVVAPMSVS